MSEHVMPGALGTMDDKPNEALISKAMGRIAQHDAASLNAIAHAVTDVLGFTTLSRRYAIAVLALEALAREVRPQARQEFHSWLSRHDAETAAKAWDEGYTVGNAHNGRRDANPYRTQQEGTE